jgi:hypothetical protein
MSEQIHNGDTQIQPGEASAIHAVDASTTPPEGIQMVEQPNPNEPLKAVTVDEEAANADVLIVIKENQGGLSFGVRIAAPVADTLNNPCHFFAEYLSKNFAWLMEQAMTEFNLRQALEQAQSRQRLKLVSADGKTPLGD